MLGRNITTRWIYGLTSQPCRSKYGAFISGCKRSDAVYNCYGRRNWSSTSTTSTSTGSKKSSRDLAKKVLANKRLQASAAEASGSSSSSAANAEGISDHASGSTSFLFTFVVSAGVLGGIGWMSFTEQGNKFAEKHILSKESVIGSALGSVNELILSPFRDFTKSSKDKLLPDMPPIPTGHVAHRTLILDLEGTLCHSEWDRKFGWRTAKRPGLDQFLAKMAQMYEVVLFSSGTFLNDQPIVMQLDQFHCISHQLYRDSTVYKDNKHIKDLVNINRQLERVIVVDDNPEEVEYHRENVLPIKAFKDVHSSDTELEKLGEFLEDMFIRDVKDVREEFASYGETTDILSAFEERKIETMKLMEKQKAKGLGGFIRRQRHL